MKKVRIFLRSIFQMLLVHKHRTLLSMMGVLFGIASLVAMGHISNATMKNTSLVLHTLGPDLIVVEPGKVRVTGYGKNEYVQSQKLHLSDAETMKNSLTSVQEVVPVINMMMDTKYKRISANVLITAASVDIRDLRNLDLEDGRFYTETEDNIGARKCVIGYNVWRTLFGEEKAFGKNLMIQKVPCEVIGVLSPKGKDLAGSDLDSIIYIPLTTLKSHFTNADSISGILLKAEVGADMTKLKKSIALILRDNHKITSMKKDDFNIYSFKDIAKAKTEGINLVSLLSKMAATITFLIGGLGIFAVMLLSVVEREKEIGIRMAVGAKRIDVLIQFLGEAVFISIIGGVAGIISGLIIAVVLIVVTDLPFTFEILSIIYVFFISLVLGIVSGAYPAFVASSLTPIKTIK